MGRPHQNLPLSCSILIGYVWIAWNWCPRSCLVSPTRCIYRG
uniref:Uncharacterized protein n=1 Tax=Rhizophora mucronata TaxID=61149 RepID=A0A2P2PP63_RHIMU